MFARLARYAARVSVTKSEGGSNPLRRVDKLPVTPKIRANLFANNIKVLFDIQAKSFHPILRGEHFVGTSRTGSGKTIAYLLPLLLRLEQERWSGPWRVLIMTPTRDLCRQVGAMVLSLSGSTPRVGLAYQGHDGCVDEATILVGTPQRLRHLLEQNSERARNVKCIVVDEADGLLSRQYFQHVEKMLRPEIQTIMFSATLPPEIMSVVRRTIPDATMTEVMTKKNPITHVTIRVPKDYGTRSRALVSILDSRMQDTVDRPRVRDDAESGLGESRRKCSVQAVVFTNHAQECEMLASHPALERLFSVKAVHGDLVQTRRDATITAFMEGQFDVLISTDIAARGLDFDVPLVVSFRPSEDSTRYVHRAGRTGRGTKEGVSVTLYDSSEAGLVKELRRSYDHVFQNEVCPEDTTVHARSMQRLVGDLGRVRHELYAPLLSRCEQWVAEGRAESILRGALAYLDGRTAAGGSVSTLSGREGFVPLQVHDPDHTEFQDSKAVLAWMQRLHSERFKVGMVAKCRGGWVVDAQEDVVSSLLEKADRESVTLRVVERMPRIMLESRRFRRAPWARQQVRVRSHGRRTRVRIAEKIKKNAK